MKIGIKLITSYLLITSFIGVVGYISFDISQQDLQKAVGDRTINLTHELIDDMEKSSYEKFVLFKLYTNTPLVKETLMVSNQEFAKLANIEDYIHKNDQEWILAPKNEISPFMSELINNELAQDLREKAAFYEKNYHNPIPEIFITNAYGANVAQSQKTSDYRQDDEEWWQVAKKDGMFIGQVNYDESADVYSNDIGVRIDDDNGNFLGVMKIVTNFENELDNIRMTKETAKQKMELTLLDDDGKVLYSTEGVHEKGSTYELFDKITGNTGHFVGQHSASPETEKLIVYARSVGKNETFSGFGGYLILEHDKEEILKPINAMRDSILSVSLAASIVAIIISIFIARSISKPIKVLTEAADEIAQGNFDSKVKITSN
ncbi:MAG: HAMP domain-containing protein, partial [Nitrosopumilaceae archaeon]